MLWGNYVITIIWWSCYPDITLLWSSESRTFLDHGRVKETSNKKRASCESTDRMWENNRLQTAVQLAFSYHDTLPIYRFGNLYKAPNVKSISFFKNITLTYKRIVSINLGVDHNKCKAIPAQGLRVPGGWGSQKARQSANEGGRVVSPSPPPHPPPRKNSRHSFLLEI